jgi:alkanesulfonate monooxygenase SsuD/methylene tetrahydromethanopterin reductase-like flavin-dependent oxidoreductase (luciferase family)
MTSQRHPHFTVFLTPDGYHESGWRVQEHDPVESASVDSCFRSAALAERGLLDAVFIADQPALTAFRASFFPQVRYDPITLLTALGMPSRRIGLFGAATTTYNTPYELARRLATADHITGGRIGWNVVTTHNRDAALNFGLDPHPERDDRYARASEFVEAVRRLWDSWPEDAIVGIELRGCGPTSVASVRRISRRVLRRRWCAAGATPASGPSRPRASRILAGGDRACRRARRRRVHAAARRRGRTRIPGEDRYHGGPLRTPPGSIRILPGLAFVLGSTEAEATDRRRALEESADPELRWRNLAHNPGLDHERIDPRRSPASPAASSSPAPPSSSLISSRSG